MVAEAPVVVAQVACKEAARRRLQQGLSAEMRTQGGYFEQGLATDKLAIAECAGRLHFAR